MDYRSLKKTKKKKTKKERLVPDIYPLPFMSCILALVGCTQSNEGSPSSYVGVFASLRLSLYDIWTVRGYYLQKLSHLRQIVASYRILHQ